MCRVRVSGPSSPFLAAGTALALGQAAEARESRDEAEVVMRLYTNMFQASAPGMFGPDTPIKAVLDRAAANAGEELSDRPVLQARVRNAIGVTYYSLGMLSEAETRMRPALEFFRRELGDQDRRTIMAMNDWAPLYYW